MLTKQCLASSEPGSSPPPPPQEISDFNKKLVLLNNDIDGKMSIHRLPLVTEAQPDSLCRVLYVIQMVKK